MWIADYSVPHEYKHSVIVFLFAVIVSLQWRHNGRDSVSKHQPYDCLLNSLLKRGSKKTSKVRVTGLCAGNSPASNAENVSIWWRHHVWDEFLVDPYDPFPHLLDAIFPVTAAIV